MNLIDNWKEDFKSYINTLDLMKDDYNGIMEYIDEVPSVEPERKTGKWTIEERDSIYGKKYILTCSECGESLSVTDSSLPYEKYCRWCGSYNGGDEE